MALRKVWIPTLLNQHIIFTLHKTYIEWYRFLLCAKHIHNLISPESNKMLKDRVQ